MKIYKGKRVKPELKTGSTIVVTVNDESLKHYIHHSPTGFNWGYEGSGPADLALSILWDFLREEPSPYIYQTFKRRFVATWGDKWEITSQEIQDWVSKTPDKFPLFI